MESARQVVLDLAEQVQRAVRGEINSFDDSADEFSPDNLVQETRKIFRRHERKNPSADPNTRGRKRGKYWVLSDIFLLRRCNVDYFPCKSEQRFLEANKFGAVAGPKPLQIPREFSIRQLEEFVYTLYPNKPLELVGISFHHIHQNKRLLPLNGCITVRDLENRVRKGKLVVMPCRDIPMPSNVVVDDRDDEELPELQWADVTQRSEVLDNQTLQIRRRVIAEQDREFEECLRTDRQRRNLATEAERIRVEEEQRRAMDLENMRTSRAMRLAAEPGDGYVIRIMTPEGTFRRRFYADDDIKKLMDFIGSRDKATENFQVTVPGGEQMNSSKSGLPLKDVGLGQATTVYVNWCDANKIEEPHLECTARENSEEAEEAEIVEVQAIQRNESIHPQEAVTVTGSAVAETMVNIAKPTYVQGPVWMPEMCGNRRRPESTPTNKIYSLANDFMPAIDDIPPAYRRDKKNTDTSGVPEVEISLKIEALALELIDPDVDRRLQLPLRRQFALTDALELIELASAEELFYKLNVVFIGESSVDDGGPSREFASLIISQLQDSYLMNGNHLSNNADALDRMDYLHLGRLVALTLLQGGPGLPVFDKPVAEYILSGKTGYLNVEDFPVMNQRTVKALQALREDTIGDTLDEILVDRVSLGSTKDARAMTKTDVEQLIQALYMQEVLGKWHASLSQFKEGLAIGGVLDLLRNNKEQSRVFLDRFCVPEVTAKKMGELCEYVFDGQPGSNLRREEEAIASSWEYFLRATESGRAKVSVGDDQVTLQLGDVLGWLTGARLLPAIGLPQKIKIYFQKDKALPEVSTCAPLVRLPVRHELKQKRTSVSIFTRWILDSQGFGNT